MGDEKRKFQDEFEANIKDAARYFAGHDQNVKGWGINPAEAKLHLESASFGPPARATFRLVVTQEMSNISDNMHGGCTATIIDALTSMLLIGVSRPGIFQAGGVSRNLNVTYLRPLPVGTEIRVICEVTQIGKRLALLRAEIRRVDNDDLCALADHQKANTDSKVGGKL